MEDRIKTLLAHGDHLFEKRQPLVSRWQETADNFYPERADFTYSRSIGQDFAANLMTSYPLLCRRDLGDSFSTMLRPSNIPLPGWFSVHTSREDREDTAAKQWLEEATKRQRRAMYDPIAGFTRATKEGDHDFAAFGQCVISVEKNRSYTALLYRCWHLRDVAWAQTYDGKCCPIYRKWKPTVHELNGEFKGKLSPEVTKLLEKEPYKEVKIRHCIVRSEDYAAPTGQKKWKTPYVSIFFEEETGHILEEVGSRTPIYVIPRWQTVSGSQYAYSPATVIALPDARLLQQMTLVLLEAGEKAVNPPLIATQDVVRSDVNSWAGSITWVDAEYDERLGDALRPLTIDSRGIPLGIELRNDVKQMLTDAFYLNKIALPPVGGREMTAYETGQRVQEYIRQALPLFEPMEMNYNGEVCKLTFDELLPTGLFGSPHDIPPSIRGAEVQFRFESPLHQAIERQKGALFQQANALAAQAAAVDPASGRIIKQRVGLRDALEGVGVPTEWTRDDKEMDALDIQTKEATQANQVIDLLNRGGQAAEQIGKAGAAINDAAGAGAGAGAA